VTAGRRPILGLTLARHTADLDALVGRTLGRRRYEVLARIAQGGMAIVYRGHDRQLDRVVAIKVPRPEFARDRGFSEQFRREARTAARLSHPNVVAVYDSGEERGLPWIVMEHVSGRTLRDLLENQRRLGPETTAELLGPVADALDHAHHAGVVHLDVKPENILLTSETVKVADFGLVRAAAQRGHGQALAATVHYCAPEVLRGGVVDGRADVYALGVVAWECLAGRAPFEGDPRQIVQQHLAGRVPPPSRAVEGVPASFDAAVAQATDPDPTRRFLRASDFATAMGAPRRRRVDEALRATTVLPPAGTDTTAGWAPAAGAAETAPAPLRPRPTTGRVPKLRAERARDRRRGWLLAVLLVLGLLAAGFATRAGGLLGGSVRVPEVVGLEIAEATQDLQSRGLRVQTAEPVASDHVHEGLVATQSVAGGEKAGRNSTVVLRPSLGIIVPDLAGRSAGGAGARLEELKIAFRRQDGTSLTVPAGRVIRTHPRAGSVLGSGRRVVVVVSVGKPKVDVPQLAGRSLAAAQAALVEAHLKGRAERVFDDDVPSGRVVGTEPGAGSRVTWGSTVIVRVSKGPDLVEVPDVVDLDREEAVERLREAGLRPSFVLPVGRVVIDQSPEPGERARRGSEVRLLLNLL
jgi:eukaryotic-like serine/threonine-protein kinase